MTKKHSDGSDSSTSSLI